MSRVWVILRISPGPYRNGRLETFFATRAEAIERFEAARRRCDGATIVSLCPLGDPVRGGNGTRKLRVKP